MDLLLDTQYQRKDYARTWRDIETADHLVVKCVTFPKQKANTLWETRDTSTNMFHWCCGSYAILPNCLEYSMRLNNIHMYIYYAKGLLIGSCWKTESAVPRYNKTKFRRSHIVYNTCFAKESLTIVSKVNTGLRARLKNESLNTLYTLFCIVIWSYLMVRAVNIFERFKPNVGPFIKKTCFGHVHLILFWLPTAVIVLENIHRCICMCIHIPFNWKNICRFNQSPATTTTESVD